MLIILLILLSLKRAIVIEVELVGQPVRLEKIVVELAPAGGLVKMTAR